MCRRSRYELVLIISFYLEIEALLGCNVMAIKSDDGEILCIIHIWHFRGEIFVDLRIGRLIGRSSEPRERGCNFWAQACPPPNCRPCISIPRLKCTDSNSVPPLPRRVNVC